MTEKHCIQCDHTGAQVEIVEQPYRQTMEHPIVEVTVWESIDEVHTLRFEEVDVARGRLALAGPLLGSVPRAVTDALCELDYEI